MEDTEYNEDYIEERLTKAGRIDARCFNGGARENSGRKSRHLLRSDLPFLQEEIVELQRRGSQMRRVKSPRIMHMIEARFRDSGSFTEGNIRETRALMDLAFIVLQDYDLKKLLERMRKLSRAKPSDTIIPKDKDTKRLKQDVKKFYKEYPHMKPKRVVKKKFIYHIF